MLRRGIRPPPRRIEAKLLDTWAQRPAGDLEVVSLRLQATQDRPSSHQELAVVHGDERCRVAEFIRGTRTDGALASQAQKAAHGPSRQPRQLEAVVATAREQQSFCCDAGLARRRRDRNERKCRDADPTPRPDAFDPDGLAAGGRLPDRRCLGPNPSKASVGRDERAVFANSDVASVRAEPDGVDACVGVRDGDGLV